MIRILAAVVALAASVSSAKAADTVELPDKKNVHVYLLMGQSNMAGRGLMTDADREPVERVVMMDKSDKWVSARHPIHFDKPIAKVGLGISFAKTMRDRADKGVTIALVPCAVGGTPLSRWQKGGDLYANAFRRAKIAAESGTLMGALWHQGEADSSAEKSATYAKRIDRMIRDLRTDLSEPRLPFVAGELIPSFVAKAEHAATVNEAIMGLPQRVWRTAGVSAEGIGHKEGDTTHISSDGLREFGKRYAAALVAIDELGEASNPRPYSARERSEEKEVKRVHPYALKLIVEGKRKEAIDYLNKTADAKVDSRHTELLLRVAKDEPGAWAFDAESWPLERGMPRTDLKQDAPTDAFTVAFGGGAGYVPEHEHMWDTIREYDPRALLLLGDNVYIDDPETPELQRFHYYRRQSQPAWMKLVAQVPVYAIWDDHDFSTDDSWGGPAIDTPAWKRPTWEIFKEQWANPTYGGGDGHPGCWFDFRIGDVHFIMLDCRYYRTNPKQPNPSMLGTIQNDWLRETLGASGAKVKVICSSVPWAKNVKPGSKDTWDGYDAERQAIYAFIAEKKIPGVVLFSADRHRSDAYKIDTGIAGMYPLYEFSSSRLTNQHVHGIMKHALFGYNEKQSFGLVGFDMKADDPRVTYTIVNIDGEKVHTLVVKLSDLQPR